MSGGSADHRPALLGLPVRHLRAWTPERGTRGRFCQAFTRIDYFTRERTARTGCLCVSDLTRVGVLLRFVQIVPGDSHHLRFCSVAAPSATSHFFCLPLVRALSSLSVVVMKPASDVPRAIAAHCPWRV